MQYRPSAAELLAALAELLEDTLLPALDPALRHQARVGANIARIVQRELELGDEGAQLERDLLAAVPDGDDAALWQTSATPATPRSNTSTVTTAATASPRAPKKSRCVASRAISSGS